MSFFSDNNNISPGRVEGNATAGLRHRVAVCVERVLDCALKQEKRDNVTLVLCAPAPPDTQKPPTFVSASSTSANARVTDLTIARIEERPAFARVKCTVTIPMTVCYEAGGEKQTTNGEIKTHNDVILYVPNASIFPFEVKCTASVNAPTGSFGADGGLTVTACITLVTKITAESDLLIPTYGFVPAPRAVDYERSECKDYFDLPLYPSGK